MSLKIEDVKAGDDVECIDIAEFSKIWREAQGYDINKMENISLLEISPCYFRLKGKFLIGNMGFDEIRPSLDCLKYFKKKDQSQQYTFDDLIGAAKKAKNDGIIDGMTLIFNDGYNDRYVDWGASENKIKQEIDYIQSLYKETFVIESEEDLDRILYELDPKITLASGKVIPFIFKCVSRSTLIFEDQSGRNCIPFVFLKGATVEQERGCNE